MAVIGKFTYEISQSVTESFVQGDTVEFTFQASGISNLSRVAEQKVDLYYSLASGSPSWQQVSDYPKAFGIGNSYSTKSFAAPVTQDWEAVKAIITGSVFTSSDDTGTGTKGTINIDYDDLKIISYQPKSQLTDEGLLVFRSPNRYIKVGEGGVEIKGGTFQTEKLIAEELEVFGDVTIFGDFQASPIPPYSQEMTDIRSGSADNGTSADYARGDHTHELSFGVVDTLLDGNTFSNPLQTTSNIKVGDHPTSDSHQLTGSVNITGSLVLGHGWGSATHLYMNNQNIVNANNISISDSGYSEGYTSWGGSGARIYVNQVNTTQNADGADTTRTLTLMNEMTSGRGAGILLRDEGNATLLATGSRVGIGTTTPSYALDVNGDAQIKGIWKFSSSGVLTFGSSYGYGTLTWDTGYASLYGQAGKRLRLGSHNTQGVLTISSSMVGIGTETPIADLDIRDGHIKVGEANIYASDVDQPYLIVADDDYYTGETTSWGTYGMQHRIKVDSGGVPRLTIDSKHGELFAVGHGGNVGIGTSASIPAKKLTISGSISASGDIYLGDSGGTGKKLYFKSATGDSYINFNDTNSTKQFSLGWENTNEQFVIATGSAVSNKEAVVVDTTGSVGIGTISPSALLHISDTRGSNILEAIRVQNSNGYAEFGAQSTYARIYADGVLTYAANTANSYFYIGGNHKATLNATGLIVAGDISASGDLNTTNITSSGNLIFSGSSGNPSVADRGIYFSRGTGTVSYVRSSNATGGEIEIGSDNRIILRETDNDTHRIEFDTNSGKVGIGTQTPENNDALLTVAGNISSSGKVYGTDFDFLIDGNKSSGSGRRFTDDDGGGVRLQRFGDTGGWAMTYGFFGSAVNAGDGIDFGGFGGHGGSNLTKFYIGGYYTKPLVSFFSGSANDGVVIGHFDNRSGAPKTLTVQGDISASGDIYLSGNHLRFTGTNNHIDASTENTIKITTQGTETATFTGTASTLRNPTITTTIFIPGDEGNTFEKLIYSHGGRGMLCKQNNAAFWQVAQGGNQFEITDGANGNDAKGNVLLRVSGVDADDNELFLVPDAGKVGIGTTTPSKELEVAGDISASGDLYVNKAIFLGGGVSDFASDSMISASGENLQISDNGNIDIIIDKNDASSTGKFSVKAHSTQTPRLVVSSSGNVGIGTTSPTSSLNIATAQGDKDEAFRSSMLTLTPTSLINSDGFTGITMETSTNTAGYGISMGARRYTTDGSPAFVINTHHNDLAGTERFRITKDGKVGIGTPNPDDTLHLETTDDTYLRLKSTGANSDSGIKIVNDAENWRIYNWGAESDQLNFRAETAGNDVLTLMKDGKVGINDYNPTYNLDMIGTMRISSSLATLILEGNGSSHTQGRVVIDVDSAARGGGVYWRDKTANTRQWFSGVSYNSLGNKWHVGYHSGSEGSSPEDASNVASAILTIHAQDTHSDSGKGNVGIGTTTPLSPLHIESSVNALSDTDEPENYHLLLRNPANDTNEGVGLAFLTSADTQDVGSSLIFKRTDTQSKGELQFYVKTNTNSDGAMTQAMTIDDSANVGIGKATPTQKLEVAGNISASGTVYAKDVHIKGTNDSIMTLQTSDDTWLYQEWVDSSGTRRTWQGLDANLDTFTIACENDTNSFLVKVPSHADAFIVSSSGRVGIGTSNPSYPLEVAGADSIGIDDYIVHNGDSNTKFGFSGTDIFKVITAGTDRMTILSNGNVGLGTSNPSAELHISQSGHSILQLEGAGTSQYQGARIYLKASGVESGNAMNATWINGHLSTDGGPWEGQYTLGMQRRGVSASIDDSYCGQLYTYRDGDGHHWYTAASKTSTSTSERLFISASGDIGIGTNTPTAKLHIIAGDESTMRLQASSGQPAIFWYEGSTAEWEMRGGSDDFGLYDYGTDKWEFRILNGNTGIGTHAKTPPKKLTVEGDISASGHIFMENDKAIRFRTGNVTPFISSSDTNNADLTIKAGDDINIIADDLYFRNVDDHSVTMTIAGEENYVGIGETSPKQKLHIAGGGDGQAFGGKNIVISENWTTVLTIGLADHESAYVKMTLNGDWNDHSGMMFLGEYFIANSAGGYNEPGQIIRQVENSGGSNANFQSDTIRTKLVSSGDTVEIQAIIIEGTAGHTETATANLNFHIMGEFDTIT